MYECMCTYMHVQSKSYLITEAGRNTITYFHPLQCFTACVQCFNQHHIYLNFVKSCAVHLYNNTFFGQHIPNPHQWWPKTSWCGRSLCLVELFSAAHKTCLWPKVTHSPDCIATMSIRLGWWWRTGRRETIAYLSQADIANLSAIRPSLISAHGTAVSFLLPHGQIRHNASLERTLGPN